MSEVKISEFNRPGPGGPAGPGPGPGGPGRPPGGPGGPGGPGPGPGGPGRPPGGPGGPGGPGPGPGGPPGGPGRPPGGPGGPGPGPGGPGRPPGRPPGGPGPVRPPERPTTLFVDNARIVSIFQDRQVGYVTISFRGSDGRNVSRMQQVVLVVTESTLITNQSGQRLSLRNLRVGMLVNAEYSANMTRSNPPQANAFRIIVVSRGETAVSVARILRVDDRNNFILTGNPINPLEQVRYNVDESTVILNRFGAPIRLRDLRPGQIVQIEHATFQTASIPPQTTAFIIQVIS